MTARWTKLSIILLALAALGWSSTASAQWVRPSALLQLPSWDANRGIAAGDFKIWPKLIVEGGYDSNVFRVSDTDPNQDAIGAGLLRIRPGLEIDNPKYNRLHFKFDLLGDARFFFATEDSAAGDAAEEQRNFGMKTGVMLHILPRSVVSVRIFDQFRRGLETRNYASPRNYNRNFNRAGLTLSLHPGGGALDFSVGYAFAIDLYDDWKEGDNKYHEVNFSTTWRFFPKTAFIIDVKWLYLTYDNPNRGGDPNGTNTNINNMPLLAYVGVDGSITARLALLVKVGYGGSFHDTGSSLHTGVGLVRLAYRFGSKAILQVGFERLFHDSYYGNFYVDNNPFLAVQWRPIRWLELRLRGGYHHMTYGDFDFLSQGQDGAPDTADDILPNQVGREEHGVSGTLAVEFDAARYVGITVGYTMNARFSNFVIQDRAGAILDEVDFLRHVIFANVIARY